MDNNFMLEELLKTWEETYKKGQLTFWVFLALKEGEKCVEDIKDFVEKVSEGTMSCEEQSLYRNLRLTIFVFQFLYNIILMIL